MYYQFIPTYDELDYIKNTYLLSSENTRVNFFFDVKNGLSGDVARDNGNVVSLLTPENKGEHLVEFVTSIINLHSYILNRMSNVSNLHDRVRFFYFCETGKSSYHKAIDTLYKSNRHLNDFLSRDNHDPIKSEIVLNALNILEKIINRFPNHYFFFGKYREFDYIPYIIGSTYFEDRDVGILYSTDKDMYQMQSYMPGRFEQLEKLTTKAKGVDWHPGRLFVNTKNYIDRLLYSSYKSLPDLTETQRNFFVNHWSLIRAIIGDAGDNVTGISGIGFKTFVNLIDSLKDIVLDREEYNAHLSKISFNTFDYKNDNLIFDMSKVKELYSKSKSVKLLSIIGPSAIERISRNIALMDYDVMKRRRQYDDKEVIDKVINFKDKFNSNEQAMQFIKATGLLNRYEDFGVSVNIK